MYKKNSEENEIDISKNTINDQFSRIGTNITKSETKEINKGEHKLNKLNKVISKNKNQSMNENFDENELYFSELNKIKIDKMISQNNKNYNKRKADIITDQNSEIERIIKKRTFKENNLDREKSENSKKIDNKIHIRLSKEKIDNISKNRNIQNISNYSILDNNLNFMENYYYKNSFKDYEDVKNGIFCISGKLFNYMYKNKDRKGAKKFMEDIIEKSKIFFGMSSIDKSHLADYFKDNPNNIVCTIGQCENDIDSIITSNVGINLKNPENKNKILCHFYSSSNDIICLETALEIGRLFFENINILENICFIYSVLMNSFIFCCLLRDHPILKNEFDFLEIEVLLLIILSFLGKSNRENIFNKQNSKIINIYYIILSAEMSLIKLGSFLLFCLLFSGDITYDWKTTLSKEFISFYYVLCSEMILTFVFCFNFCSFYKENIFRNKIFVCLSLLFLSYITALTFLCSSNMDYDIFNITFFIHNERIVDSFSDKNKAFLTLVMVVDIVLTFLFCSITKQIFKRYLK